MSFPVQGQSEIDELRFAEALIRWNGMATRAFREAFPHSTATPQSVSVIASRWAAKPAVQAKLTELRLSCRVAAEAAAKAVVERARAILDADAAELSRSHVHACRHCHGEGHRYQFTPREYERKWIEYAHEVDKAAARKQPAPPLFEDGGIGYSVKLDPHPDCPECGGQGHTRVIIADTRKLSPGAAALFAGVKRTKNGIEVMTEDRSAWAEKIMRAAGAYIERRELSGPNGGPIPNANLNATVPAEDAARAYADMVKG